MPKKIEARRSAIHGNGVFAIAPIEKGDRVIRYKGLLRTHSEVDRVYADEAETGHTFLFTLNDKYVIDANVDGNDARWINHSCDPNCEATWLEHDSKKRKDRIYIEAMRDIAAGEELTYNYGIVLDEPYTAELKKLWACHCGTADCTGTMLQPKPPKKSKKSKKAKKTKATQAKTSKPKTTPSRTSKAKTTPVKTGTAKTGAAKTGTAKTTTAKTKSSKTTKAAKAPTAKTKSAKSAKAGTAKPDPGGNGAASRSSRG